MIEGKGLGGKKVNRVNLSLSNKYHAKLNKLAVACNIRPTTLAAALLEKCLDNPKLIAELQADHNIHSAYKIVPVNHQGEVIYTLKEG